LIVNYHQIVKNIIVAGLTLSCALLHGSSATAQHNATMYFMRDLPAVNMLNPAFQPEAGSVYVGFPVISSIYLDGGITLGDMNIGNLLSRTPRLTRTAENASFRESGYANLDLNMLNVGVFIHGMYFTLDVAEKTRFEASLPGDFIRQAWRGNAPYMGQAISLSGLGAQLNSYAEVALGVSKEVVRNKITVGGKVKRLMGVASVDMNFGDAAFMYTDPDTWSTTVGVTPQATFAGIPSNITSEGVFSYDTAGIGSYSFSNFSGKGWGIDAGFEIKSEKITVSGSIVNFGGIAWDSKHVALQRGNLVQTFSGVQNTGDTHNLIDVVDSLKSELFTVSSGESLQWTSPTMSVGVSYLLNEHVVAGALAAITVGRYNTYPLLALSLNTRKYPINGSFSYSYGHSHNLGLGLLLGQRNMQLHVICDNILAANYQTAQKFNLRMGLNLLVGGPKPTGDKKKVWSPLSIIHKLFNTYKTTGSKLPLNAPSSPSMQPVNKQPLNPINTSPAAQPANRQPLNPVRDNGVSTK
jgi:hypothetical protein